MKTNRKGMASAEAASHKPRSGARELIGLVELGMKCDALREARDVLKQTTLNAELFNAALHAVLILGDRLNSWAPLVESAYGRLSKRGQRAACCSMLSFHYYSYRMP